ncbi:MAG: 50S ribosomal protein L29 [Micavibrio sp.]|nr:50S ribosomal protein L29 [Micavibrio sp.]|tara:strand:+ start:213 stop:500 length:288 start_codon:yes stop_codon:yes gene_type:complete
MKADELRSKSQDELKKFILDQRKEEFNLRFQKANGALENTSQLRTVGRNVARAKTLLTESVKGVKPAAKKATTTKAAPKKATTAKAAPKKAAAKK